MTDRRLRGPDEPFSDLESRVFTNATVIPATRAPDGRFLMGAFDSHGQPVRESLLSRIRHGVERQKGFPGELTGERLRVDGTAIYAGVLDRHFGHFVLEGLARLWVARRHPELPIVWSVESWRRGENVPGYRPWQAEILELLGISNRPVFVAQETSIDELVIPAPGYVMEEFFHPTHRDFLSVLDHTPVDHRKTWLSRGHLAPGVSGNRSATVLERRLADAGWRIVHPEELSIAEQVKAIATSERLAGEQGSAFHSVMFLREVARLNVDIISRAIDFPAELRNHDYETIAAAKGFKLRIHRADFERVIERRSIATVHKIAQNTFRYLDLLGEPSRGPGPTPDSEIGPTMAKPPPTRLSRRLRRLATTNGATSYLEIGARGRTFLNVSFAVKHAVDPHFRFDVRPFEASGTQFFEMSSDDFFVHFAKPHELYDLIFLNRLATFEQTLRALCSSMLHSHADTIWLINNVLPVDVVSSTAGLPRGYKLRRFRGRLNDTTGTASHGDLFKIIYAVHDFFPNLSYRVVARPGNPQMTVIRRQRKDFSPRFHDFEQISRLTYFDLLDDRPRLKLASEDEVVRWLESSLATEAAGDAG